MRIKSIKINHLDAPKKYYDVINANPFNNFFIKTNTAYICSHNCFFDEVSFQRNQDIEKQKKKANDMIDTAIGGMKTRFVHRGKNPTLLVLASSKRSDKSFLEEHMRKKLISEKDNVYISDGSVWEVKPPGTYSDTTFRVALGNKFLDSVVMKDDEDIEAYREKGYSEIINVPIDFKPDFLDDIDRALCDFAGISASSISKYINGAAAVENVTDRIKNPFSREILEIGDGPDDAEVQYYNFFDLDKIDPALRYKPLFIHLDMSYSGDMTGIAGIFIRGKKHSQIDLDQSKDLFYSLAFSVSIKAPRGRHISFEKNRNFIYWLKSKGFNIRGITTDTYQSYDTGETLRAKGYPYSVLSVDRVDTNHVCLLGSTKVKTPKGSKEIKDLIPGEEIYSYDIENNCEVLTTFDSWEYTDDVEEYYEITTFDGSKIKCTGNHLILTARGYIRADELSENDFIRQSTKAKLCVDSIEGDKVCV